MSDTHTRLPWRADNRDWRGEPSWDYFIVGDICDPDEGDEGGRPFAVAVAVVKGNATAGEIPRLNADLIVRAVNSHADMLAALGALVEAGCEDGRHLAICQQEQWAEAVRLAKAALAKAK